MRHKMTAVRVVDKSGKIELPNDVLNRLKIENNEEVSLRIEAESLSIVLSKKAKLSKQYVKQQKIVNVVSMLTKMNCFIYHHEKVVETSNESIIPKGECKIAQEVKAKIVLDKDYDSKNQAMQICMFDNCDKYILKKVYSLKFFETDLGSLVIFGDKNESEIESLVKDYIENLADFAVGNTCMPKELYKM